MSLETLHYCGFDIPVHIIMPLTGGGPETFVAIANSHIRHVDDLIGYRPDAFVVEIGCGIGKDAMGLTGILGETGRYLGIDIIKRSIDWCQENITSRYPNFTFVHYDVKDQLHNPLGKEDISVCRIPAADGSVDIIILHSVFTHLLEDGISVYLGEFARVLKPESGRVYASCFVVDEDIRRQILGRPRTQYALEFAHPFGDGCWINVPEFPTGAVAYSMDKIEQMVAAAGLEFDRPLVRGNWSGCFAGLPEGQDVILLRPGSAPVSFSGQSAPRETLWRRTQRFFTVRLPLLSPHRLARRRDGGADQRDNPGPVRRDLVPQVGVPDDEADTTTILMDSNSIETDELIFCIEHSWSTDFRVGLIGWAVWKTGHPGRITLQIDDGSSVEITSWLRRPDVRSTYAQYLETDFCGFAVQIDRLVEQRVTVRAAFGAKEEFDEFRLRVPGKAPTRDLPAGRDLWGAFVAEVNERCLHVLEVGSRQVSLAAEPKRKSFGDGVKYTGFDYYKDENTDIVGDAHCLSEYFPNQRFGALYSQSVLEHLAMPWIAALEMIRILEINGLMYHQCPAAWPPHELPWDFWRISVEGLQVLFSPVFGMKIEGISRDSPLRMYFDDLIPSETMFPLAPAYGAATILARKVADIDYSKFKWTVTLSEVLGSGSAYRKP